MSSKRKARLARNVTNSQQLEAWKRALASHHAQQRSQRGKRKRGMDAAAGPGMVRRGVRDASSTADGDRAEPDSALAK